MIPAKTEWAVIKGEYEVWSCYDPASRQFVDLVQFRRTYFSIWRSNSPQIECVIPKAHTAQCVNVICFDRCCMLLQLTFLFLWIHRIRTSPMCIHMISWTNNDDRTEANPEMSSYQQPTATGHSAIGWIKEQEDVSNKAQKWNLFTPHSAHTHTHTSQVQIQRHIAHFVVHMRMRTRTMRAYFNIQCDLFALLLLLLPLPVLSWAMAQMSAVLNLGPCSIIVFVCVCVSAALTPTVQSIFTILIQLKKKIYIEWLRRLYCNWNADFAYIAWFAWYTATDFLLNWQTVLTTVAATKTMAMAMFAVSIDEMQKSE